MTLQAVLEAIHHVSKKTNLPVYAVGGFVRDFCIHQTLPETKDVDFVVEGSGIAFAQALDSYLEEAGTLVEFADFDTARYVFMKEEEGEKRTKILEIEFAGARSEAYEKDSRKPVVTAATLASDLTRRDFTVNAMAIPVIALQDVSNVPVVLGAVIDPLGGMADLGVKMLRTPLDPDATFSDDPLRMMRAARFAAQLSFSLHDDTEAALARNAHRLEIISKERIQEELFKLLAAPVPSIGLWILYIHGLFPFFLPEVVELAGVEEVKGYKHKDNLSHTFAVVDNLAQYTNKPLLILAALLHDIAKPQTKAFSKGRGWTFDMHEHLGKKMTRDIGRMLRMKKQDVEYVAKLVRWHLQPIALVDKGVTDSAIRRLIVNLGDDLQDLLLLCRSDVTTGNQLKKKKRLENYDYLEKRIAEVIEMDKLRAFQSPVRGEEIMQICGLKPGPTVGKLKEEIEEAILDGKIPNEYDPAYAYLMEIKDEFLARAAAWEFVSEQKI